MTKFSIGDFEKGSQMVLRTSSAWENKLLGGKRLFVEIVLDFLLSLPYKSGSVLDCGVAEFFKFDILLVENFAGIWKQDAKSWDWLNLCSFLLPQVCKFLEGLRYPAPRRPACDLSSRCRGWQSESRRENLNWKSSWTEVTMGYMQPQARCKTNSYMLPTPAVDVHVVACFRGGE